ncbi:MAG TPA: DUF4286 family protein [Saprospiraceae bacterium]|nr:DUF4286 family protein [Saprospiraceae bacterium]HRG21563.1 DUF4286 family protein [Saprospiraceae bacterium]
MPVVYNVTIIIDHSVHDEWVDWMKNEHIPEVMATGKFTSWKMLRIIEDHNPDGMTYAIQYHAPDMEAYVAYQQECASALQQKTQNLFGGKFAAFRTLLEELASQ